MAALRAGSSGASVADLQRRLIAMGFNPGPVDGQYGKLTMAAVREYQQSVGLSGDGVFGPDTAAAFAAQGAPTGQPVAPQAQAPGATAVINPEEDPQFLAFQRAQGLSEDQLRASIAMQRQRASVDLANRMPVLAEQHRQDVQGISNDYESRGIAGAGNQKLDTLRADTEYGRQTGLANLDYNRQVEDLNGSLASQVAQNRMNTSEEDLAARARLSQYNAQTRGLQ